MTVASHTHGCHEVDQLQDEIRDHERTISVLIAEHMRRAGIEAAARRMVAVFKLDSSDPNVDIDLALTEAGRALTDAVDAAEDPRLTPDALVGRLRVAVDDPGMVLERYRGRNGEAPHESLSAWQLRAVLHVLTHGVKADT